MLDWLNNIEKIPNPEAHVASGVMVYRLFPNSDGDVIPLGSEIE
jgi:hypothetical protein